MSKPTTDHEHVYGGMLSYTLSPTQQKKFNVVLVRSAGLFAAQKCLYCTHHRLFPSELNNVALVQALNTRYLNGHA